MTLTAEAVAAASAAWVWVPDNATIATTDEYTIFRMPDYFEFQLFVNAFRPAGPLGAAVDRVLDRVRSFGLPEVRWPVRLEDPAGLAAVLDARLTYAVTHGAAMALVRGTADTSGPILRRAGFSAFGHEPHYIVPL
jgi:hypothetical protein